MRRKNEQISQKKLSMDMGEQKHLSTVISAPFNILCLHGHLFSRNRAECLTHTLLSRREIAQTFEKRTKF